MPSNGGGKARKFELFAFLYRVDRHSSPRWLTAYRDPAASRQGLGEILDGVDAAGLARAPELVVQDLLQAGRLRQRQRQIAGQERRQGLSFLAFLEL